MAMSKIYQSLPKAGQQAMDKLANWALYRGGKAATSTFWEGEFRKAPASHPPPVLPKREDHNVFDITYYRRDYSRNNVADEVAMSSQGNLLDSPQGSSLLIPKTADEPVTPSPGRKDPDVARYSRDGLRSTMTATIAARNARLAQHRPDHLPMPDWARHREGVVAAATAEGKPIPFGTPYNKWKRSRWAHTGRLVEM
ncbi:unnamed protein product [Symbiodinium sp. KB8]|nr:unnamed protein product [Symbiodinium sp. KB8]